MRDNNFQDRKDKKGMSPLAAGVAGAVIGAGVAAAGAVVLKDEKNRKAAKQILNKAKSRASDYAEDVMKTVRDKEGDVKAKLDKSASEARKAADSAKGSARKIVNEIKR